MNRSNGDEVAQSLEASLAYTAHHDQVLDAAKRAVLLAMFDDARGQSCADPRQLLQFFTRGRVEMNGRGRCGARLLK